MFRYARELRKDSARLGRFVLGFVFGLVLAAVALPSKAVDLGVEGVVYEPIEEDIRIAFMRMIAREDVRKMKLFLVHSE